MPNQFYNPIKSVGGTTIPCPSSFEWQESDISDSDAGRTEDGDMHKMMIGQKVHINLAWQNVTTAQASIILKAFTRQEYFSVNYLDPKENQYLTKTFYVGDRSAPSYNTLLGIWENVSFNIIEQ